MSKYKKRKAKKTYGTQKKAEISVYFWLGLWLAALLVLGPAVVFAEVLWIRIACGVIPAALTIVFLVNIIKLLLKGRT